MAFDRKQNIFLFENSFQTGLNISHFFFALLLNSPERRAYFKFLI